MNTVCWAGLLDGEERGWYLSDIEEAYLGAEDWDGCNLVPIKDPNSVS